MERITNGKIPYVKAYKFDSYSYGQVDIDNIPNIHNYDDFKAYYDSVTPYSRGKYKGVKPFGRRHGYYKMEEDSVGIHVLYLRQTNYLELISVYKNGEIWIRNLSGADSTFKTHVDHLFHFDLAVKWNSHSYGIDNAPYMNIVHNGRTYFTNENHIKFKRLDFKELVTKINTNSWGTVTKNGFVTYQCLNAIKLPRLTLNVKKKNALLKRHEHLKKYADTFLPLLCQNNKHLDNSAENVSEEELLKAIKKYRGTHGDVDLTQNNVDAYSDLLHCIVGTIEKERALRNSWSNPNAPITFKNFVGDLIPILRANEVIDEAESDMPVTKATKKYMAWLNP